MKEEDLEEEEDLERAAYRVSRAVEAMKKELQLPSSIVMPILLKLIEVCRISICGARGWVGEGCQRRGNGGQCGLGCRSIVSFAVISCFLWN